MLQLVVDLPMPPFPYTANLTRFSPLVLTEFCLRSAIATPVEVTRLEPVAAIARSFVVCIMGDVSGDGKGCNIKLNVSADVRKI